MRGDVTWRTSLVEHKVPAGRPTHTWSIIGACAWIRYRDTAHANRWDNSQSVGDGFLEERQALGMAKLGLDLSNPEARIPRPLIFDHWPRRRGAPTVRAREDKVGLSIGLYMLGALPHQHRDGKVVVQILRRVEDVGRSKPLQLENEFVEPWVKRPSHEQVAAIFGYDYRSPSFQHIWTGRTPGRANAEDPTVRAPFPLLLAEKAILAELEFDAFDENWQPVDKDPVRVAQLVAARARVREWVEGKQKKKKTKAQPTA